MAQGTEGKRILTTVNPQVLFQVVFVLERFPTFSALELTVTPRLCHMSLQERTGILCLTVQVNWILICYRSDTVAVREDT